MIIRKGHDDVDGRHKRRDDADAHVCKRKSEIRRIWINNLVEFGFNNELYKLWYCRSYKCHGIVKSVNYIQ